MLTFYELLASYLNLLMLATTSGDMVRELGDPKPLHKGWYPCEPRSQVSFLACISLKEYCHVA